MSASPARARWDARPRRGLLALAALVCALLVVGCSTLRLAYGQAPNLALWWADRYADFSPEQTAQTRDAIDRWFGWHRKQQLPSIIRVLGDAAGSAQGNPDARLICAWVDDAQQWRDDAFEQALPALARIAGSLDPRQIERIERRQQAVNDEFRDDFLQADRARRQRAALDRTLERVELLYGPVDARQEAVLAEWIRRSPFDPERWLEERQRRQRDLLETLKSLNPAAPPSEAEAALRLWWHGVVESPDTGYRNYSERLIAYNCEFAAQFHLITSMRQRDHAAERLRGWQRDLSRFVLP